ncbi:MAG: helix-hairpin-helix domain-containing protein [Saprospiraceae bacterium]
MDKIKSLKPSFTRQQRDRTAGLMLLILSCAGIAYYAMSHRIRPEQNREVIALFDWANRYYDSVDQATAPKAFDRITTRSHPGKPNAVNKKYPSGDKIPSIASAEQWEDPTADTIPTPAKPIQEKKVFHVKPKSMNQRTIQPVDINTPEPLDWEALPGIGPFYAAKIMEYRDRLGGFHTVQQVAETWNLPDSTFRQIQPYLVSSPIYRPMDLNKAEVETLAKHPYLSWKDAKLIVRYREQHGRYAKIEELLNIHAFDTTFYQRIAPYFTVIKLEPTVSLTDNQ